MQKIKEIVEKTAKEKRVPFRTNEIILEENQGF